MCTNRINSTGLDTNRKEKFNKKLENIKVNEKSDQYFKNSKEHYSICETQKRGTKSKKQ